MKPHAFVNVEFPELERGDRVERGDIARFRGQRPVLFNVEEHREGASQCRRN